MRLLPLASLFLLGVFPAAALAHADGPGTRLGEYVVEVSVLPESPPLNESASVLVGFEAVDTRQPQDGVPFWVRLNSPDGVVFSSDDFVSDDKTLSVISFLPLSAGPYSVDVRALDADGQVAGETLTHEFTVPAARATEAEPPVAVATPPVPTSRWLQLGVLGLAGVSAGVFLARLRRQKK